MLHDHRLIGRCFKLLDGSGHVQRPRGDLFRRCAASSG
jgi:hypothetical protein